jgi:hypothetical protein
MKGCYNCASRQSYPDKDLCRITKQRIRISLTSGEGCTQHEIRHCVKCTWDYTPKQGMLNTACPQEPVNSCKMFLI